jgi:putative Holliday junction resolvase
MPKFARLAVEMGRILAIDYGRRRVGLAISDPMQIIAQGLPTLLINSPRDIIKWVLDQRDAREIERIVLGLPRSLSGGIGPMGEEVTEFSRALEKRVRIPVTLMDERMTSRQAHATFAEAGKKLKGRKEAIDKISATILLQQYLESVNPSPDAADLAE